MKKQAELRKDLVARLVELGHRVDEFEDEMRAPLEADFAEQATQMEGAEVTAELEHAAIAEAEQIKAAIGLSPVKVRAIANASDGQIVALPQKGYRLLAHAAVEDIRHAVQSLRSRIREISRRADETERRAKLEGRW